METEKLQVHIVASPIKYLFKTCKYDDEEVDNERIYLLSAHVETSESSGLKGAFTHFRDHFSKVANYPRGHEMCTDFLETAWSKETLDSFLFQNKKDKIDSVEGNLLTRFFRARAREIRFSDSKTMFKTLLKGALVYGEGSILGLAFILCYLMQFFVIPLISWLTIFQISYAKGLLEIFIQFMHINLEIILSINQVFYTSPMLGVTIFLTLIIFPLITLISSILLIFVSLNNYSEAEKDSLYVLLSGICYLLLSFTPFLNFKDYNVSIIITTIVGLILFLNLIYFVGMSYPRFRIISVFVFTMTLGGLIFFQIPKIPFTPIQNFFAAYPSALIIIFSVLLIFLLGYFYNFSKSVEVILEIEYSFGLLLGKNVSRKTLREEFFERFKVPRIENVIQRFFNLVRRYLDFRPQGTIEVHKKIDELNFIPKEMTKESNLSFFKVIDIYFDGDKAKLTLDSHEQVKKIIFSGFIPQ